MSEYEFLTQLFPKHIDCWTNDAKVEGSLLMSSSRGNTEQWIRRQALKPQYLASNPASAIY